MTGVAGCSPSPFEPAAAAPRPPGPPALEARRPDKTESTAEFTEPTGRLTLEKALAATLLGNPRLAAASYEARAREAEIIQVRLLPNPELEFEIEEFGGTGEVAGFDTAEYTLALSQLIELGGKRSSRIRAARLEARLAAWDYELQRLDALSATAADFIVRLAARREVETARETLDLAERVATAVDQRVEAGKVSPVDASKARVELAQARSQLRQSEQRLHTAALRLAGDWGSTRPRFDDVVGDLEQALAPPELEVLLDRLHSSPDLLRWAAQIALRQAEIEQALAQRVPDVAIAGGVSYLSEIEETAFRVGLAVPLPIFDRAEGSLRAARLRAIEAGHLEEAAVIEARTAVAEAHQQLQVAYVAVAALREEILPATEQAFAAADEAFRQGKIGSLDLLDAQRSLVAARAELIDALTNYHLAVIECERLLGAPLFGGNNASGEDR